MKSSYLLSLIFVYHAKVVLSWIPSTATTKSASITSSGRRRSKTLLLGHRNQSFDNDGEFNWAATKIGNYLDMPSDSTSLYTELFARRAQLDLGIGKRYVCRTHEGYVNIHYQPGDPFNTDNILGRMEEGKIVMSTGPPRGPWIQHDGGGWSIAEYGGFTWLEALEEWV